MKLPHTRLCKTEAETTVLARDIAAWADNGTVLLMEAPMGAGKTTWTQAFARELLGANSMSAHSPTFTVENSYAGNGRKVIHQDLYRLKHWEEWLALAIFERHDPKNSVLCIEWADLFSHSQWGQAFVASGWKLFTLKAEILSHGERRWTLSEG